MYVRNVLWQLAASIGLGYLMDRMLPSIWRADVHSIRVPIGIIVLPSWERQPGCANRSTVLCFDNDRYWRCETTVRQQF
jgi:hypothetical protein